MRSEHALRYLLLKHLWRLRGTTGDQLHTEVARSLVVDRLDGVLRLSWRRAGVPHTMDRAEAEFAFYTRGDAPARDAAQAIDNDSAARALAAELLGIAPAPIERPQPPSLYLDVWRWPLVHALAGTAGLVASRSVLPPVLAATAVVESRWRSYWLYVPLALAPALAGFRFSAIVLSAALAFVVALASTDARGRFGALGYLIPTLIGWQMPAAGHSDLSNVWFAVVAMAAAAVWIWLWLAYEAPRVTILLTPLLVVTLFADGHPELATVYLAACLAYAVWLSPFMRIRA